MDDAAIRACIVARLAARSPAASICPSDVARALRADEPAWRAVMPEVRRVAAALAHAGVVQATQGDARVPADAIVSARGPLRLRRGPRFQAPG